MIKDMDLWEQTFQRIIREKKPHHRWKLKVDDNLEVKSLRPGWKQYTQKGLARFRCSLCGRSWVSAQVLILFWMCLKEPYGRVKMRVFAQRCQRCSTALFEEPEFSPEGIEKILGCLVVRILLKCYRESAGAPVPREDPLREILVAGPHDAGNCEACLVGISCPSQSDGKVSKALPRRPHNSAQYQQPASKRGKLLLLLSLCIVIVFVVLMVTLGVTGLL
ncbi:receptor-transporting protein 4 [Sarcophilus harrisii]|uniref:Receptor transporter protein 4 n=1 Tax=Sarcophilus harrisii TaxID=9305 RepID=G3WSG5_SARHA|nr:receptor-transporting protein 4 [Sarcophilus harrisii]